MINALLDGEAITFSRFELPPDHPQAAPHGGNPTDTLELGAEIKRSTRRAFRVDLFWPSTVGPTSRPSASPACASH